MIRIEVYRLSIPLKEPYQLSFGVLNHFDTFILRLIYRGTKFYGETTALPVYSWETPETIWANLNRWLSMSKGSFITLNNIVTTEYKNNPFAATPILTAIEKIKSPINHVKAALPMVGTVSKNDLPDVEESTLQLLAQGFKTIKIKATGNVKHDVRKTKLIQRLSNGKALIRIDANQSYTFDNIKTFMKEVDPQGIELFEQPFKPDAWDDMKKLAQISPLPLMLDESIWNEDDILKTIALKCAKFIKLKLVKHASPARALRLITIAKEAGLGVVLGNGAQSDIGCYNEALVYIIAGLDSAAEANGFLKQKRTLFKKNLNLIDGQLQIDGEPEVDMNAIEELCIDKVTFPFRDYEKQAGVTTHCEST